MLGLSPEDYINSHFNQVILYFSLQFSLHSRPGLVSSFDALHNPSSQSNLQTRCVSNFFLSLSLLSSFSPSAIQRTLNIQKLNNDFAVLFDSNRKGEIVTLFTTNLTYNVFTKTLGDFTIRGGKEFTRLISNLTVFTTQISISTQSYTLQPPFDALGGASRATGYSNFNAILFKDNKTQFFDAVNKDKYVKTTDFAQYGGWKIEQRDYISLAAPRGYPLFDLSTLAAGAATS